VTVLTKLLDQIYSWPFFIVAFAGFGFQRLYCIQKMNWLDKHHPLPDGAKHRVGHVSRVWLAGLLAVVSLGYVLLTAQKTHDQTIGLTNDVGKCWTENYDNTKAQVKLNQENDQISRQQQNLQRQFDIATSDWLKALVNPPGTLKNEPTNSPARQAWGLEITGVYQNKLNDLGGQSDALVQKRKDLDDERAKHPLPEAKCGR
jgi:hypothetical protein